jgi:hypothetical protein
VIFMPMLGQDNEAAAMERIEEFSDSRLTYYWDEQRLSGEAWRDAYELEMLAWDVYMLYRPGTVWEDTPTRADYAMTGHSAIEDKLSKLRIEQYAAEAEKLLRE